MLEYLYVCRHGFRSNWVDPSIKTGPTGLPRDPPLAAYGLAQSERLAAFLSSPSALAPHPLPERVFSSPFYRCVQTSVPTAQALRSGRGKAGEGEVEGKGKGDIMLDHGAMEWYSPVNPDTGLHPRPGSAADLAPLFPDQLDLGYSSTVYPSRRGELLRDLQDRADLFVEAWTGRVQEMGVRSAVLFGHAASVIAIGRALTGDKSLEVPAGCASCSLYRRKVPSSISPDDASAPGAAGQADLPAGVGEWEPVWLGRADYLENGVERNWSFRDVVISNGEVISDDGDHAPHPSEDAIPVGLASGMERYLVRGKPGPNESIKELMEIEQQGTAVHKGRM